MQNGLGRAARSIWSIFLLFFRTYRSPRDQAALVRGITQVKKSRINVNGVLAADAREICGL
jgi:hypothetical protein